MLICVKLAAGLSAGRARALICINRWAHGRAVPAGSPSRAVEALVPGVCRGCQLRDQTSCASQSPCLTVDPVLVLRPCRGPFPDLVLACSPGMHPCLSACFPGLTGVPAARAGRRPAGAAVSDRARPALLVATGVGLGLTSATLHRPFAPAGRVGSAGSAVAGWNAALPAAPGSAPVKRPVVPAWKARVPFAETLPDTAAARQRHGAGSGNSGCEAVAAADAGDTGRLNTGAGKQEAVRARAQNCGSNGPIHFAVAPIRGPSVRPSVAGHRAANRRSRGRGPVVADRDTQHEQRHRLGAHHAPWPVVPGACIPVVALVDPVHAIVEEEIRTQAWRVIDRVAGHRDHFGIGRQVDPDAQARKPDADADAHLGDGRRCRCEKHPEHKKQVAHFCPFIEPGDGALDPQEGATPVPSSLIIRQMNGFVCCLAHPIRFAMRPRGLPGRCCV